MKHNIQPKALISKHTTSNSANYVQHQSLSDDHLLIKQISQLNPNLPKPKLLKSCIRCRKHKTKCDAQNRAPLPCSSCFKKGCACKIDYVLPPQRSDNLKNLISQVDFIKDQYDTLSSYYLSIGEKLGVKLESFEDWRNKSWLCEDEPSPCSVNSSCTNNSTTSDLQSEAEQESNGTNSLINLIKLSDGSFISMDINNEANQLIINNNVIYIPEFERLVSNLLAKLHHINSIFLNNFNNQSSCENETDDSTSSISSPISPKEPNTSIFDNVPTNWFDLQFDVKSLFKSNKFLLIMLVSFYYPHFQLNFQLFLKDYLISYYSIIETLNKSSNTSTYSANLLMNTLMNKQRQSRFPSDSSSTISSSSASTNNGVNSSHVIIFNKFQLRCLIDVEIFNSELFLKKLIELLFLNVIINGLDSNLEILNQFVKFVELNINNNRKKLNFDKNENLKLIEKFMQLFNLFQNFDIKSSPSSNGEDQIFNSNKKQNLKSNGSVNSLSSLSYNNNSSTIQSINEKNFLKFEELLLIDFEFFQKSALQMNNNSNNTINQDASLLLNIDPDFTEFKSASNANTTNPNNNHTNDSVRNNENIINIDQNDEQNASLRLQQLSLFKPFNNNSLYSISPSSTSIPNIDGQNNSQNLQSNLYQFNNHELKSRYNRFIDKWSNFYSNFESKHSFINSNNSSSSSIFNVEKLFIDDFLLELKILNVSILIFKGFHEFQPLLYQILEHYSINDSLIRFINLFTNSNYLNEQNENLINQTENNNSSHQDLDISLNDEGYFGEFSCEKMKLLYMNLKNIIFKNNIYKESSSRMNDIQVILENVDWKKESTDDVLRKIGVINI